MNITHNLIDNPFFSVCIPHHNRTSFMIEVCRSLVNQKFKNFEICVSDDCSTDGRQEELVGFLKQSGASFIYYKQEKNVRYDANLRSSIGLARGKYCFLLGNDDCLSSPRTLELLHSDINRFMSPDIVLTNYRKFADGMEFRRIERTGIIGAGPEVAASNFRKFSFVSGVILNASKSKSHATDRWDGSEMYQTFIACRMISQGSILLGIDECSVMQGIKIRGQEVESYASKARITKCSVTERHIPLNSYGKLVIDGIGPCGSLRQKRKINEYVIRQILFFTYPYWIFEYRRVQSWRYALGICLGMRPRNILTGVDLSFWQIIKIRIMYGLVSLVALSAPAQIFIFAYPMLYKFTKRNFG